MVYNTSYTPTDMVGIFQDLIAEFFKQGIVWVGAIIAVVIIIVIIRAIKGRN
jgi:hypothetical protein